MNEHLPDDLLGDIKRPNNSNQWFLSEQRKVKEEGGKRKEEEEGENNGFFKVKNPAATNHIAQGRLGDSRCRLYINDETTNMPISPCVI